MSKLFPSGINKPLVFFTAGIFGLVFLLSVAGLWMRLDNYVYDSLVRFRVAYFPLEQSPRIIPVDLNDRAERNLGENLDTRQIFADLFSVFCESNVTAGMDFLFSGGRDTASDKLMADFAGRTDRLVMAVVPLDAERTRFSGNPLDAQDVELIRNNLWYPQVKNAGKIPVASSFLMPNRALAQNSAYLAHIGVSPDSDGVYRRSWLFYRFEDGYIPSLSMAMAAAELGVDTSRVVIDAGKQVLLPLKDGRTVKIPIDKAGNALVPYPSHWLDGWKRIPLDKFLNASFDDDVFLELSEAIFGANIVVSDVTTAAKDFGITPFDGLYPLSGLHTSLLNAVYEDRFFAEPPFSLRIVCFILVFSACLFFAHRKTDRFFHLGFLCTFLCFTAGLLLLWFLLRISPWFAVPALSLFFSWIYTFTVRIFHLYKQKLLMQNALTRYFPRSLASRILAENRADLKPSNKELTIVFSDISGFTKWSSDKQPEVVHSFLSDYLTAMSEILFAYGGTVDKFMGDGILAFFGDPFFQSDHASRALRAALAMQKKVAELKDKWLPEAGIDLKIRVGINSGNVIVGNLGSSSRVEYTVIGAAVNLASRMESNAPVGSILVAEQTRVLSESAFVFGENCPIAAKGYEKPVNAYVLLSEST